MKRKDVLIKLFRYLFINFYLFYSFTCFYIFEINIQLLLLLLLVGILFRKPENDKFKMVASL